MAEPGLQPAANDSALGPSQNLAYDIDEIGRIITVVYIGDLTDAAVLDFYRGLVKSRPDAPDHDFLLDLRYTAWAVRADTIVQIDALFAAADSVARRRIAVVRKGNAALYETTTSELMRVGIGDRYIRYFDQLDAAHDWLTGRRPV